MKIAIMVEGKTEQAFKPHLNTFLKTRLEGRMPRLDLFVYHGRIPTEQKLRRTVEGLLSRHPISDAVIALTDVYTGTLAFSDGNDAKNKMRAWVGSNPNFYPHVAQHDFEAWLLPYWDEIQSIAGHNRRRPSGPPESVNHQRPPSHHIREIFRTGKLREYVKPRDANRILKGKDLAISATQCPELRAFLNTILTLCGGQLL